MGHNYLENPLVLNCALKSLKGTDFVVRETRQDSLAQFPHMGGQITRQIWMLQSALKGVIWVMTTFLLA